MAKANSSATQGEQAGSTGTTLTATTVVAKKATRKKVEATAPRKATEKTPARSAATTPARKAQAKKAPAKTAITKARMVTTATVDEPTSSSDDAAQSPREARRLQRIEMSREQILDTAEELFAENGYYETGLKDVAARCEFSVGSIYSFFDNKDSLYEQVLMRRSIGLDAINQLVPESVPADERLVKLAEIQIEHAREHPAWGALTAELSRIARSRGSVVPEPWHHYGERVFGFLVEVFEKGHEEGTLRPGSPPALASLYHAVLSSFILVSSLSAKSGGEEWPGDTDEFLNFVRDTFSSRTPGYLEESAARRRRAE